MPTLATPIPFPFTTDSHAADSQSCARELTFSEAANSLESPASVLQRLAVRLRDARATPIGLMIFGAIAARPVITSALLAALGEPTWPVLWVEGASCHGAPLAGVQAFALRDGPVRPIRLDGRVVASCYKLGDAELCWVGASLPDDPRGAPGRQTTQAFRALERALHAAGFSLGDLVRTWCYNHHLLAWYPEFNHARSELYREVVFRTGSTPASTGISAANPAGAALVLAGLALRPAIPGRGAREIGSPLQCPAPAYGSAFSRAMELDLGATRRLLVSGTASIEPGGATAWAEDVHAQIWLTMRVVGAILKSRGLDWAHVTRGLAYFKSPDAERVFDRWCREHHWSNPPCLRLHCDICRDDLLFELEVDAED